MRIQIPLHPLPERVTAALVQPAASKPKPRPSFLPGGTKTPAEHPLVQLGDGEFVLLDMQGVIEVEGDVAEGVVGKLDVSRADRPVLFIGFHRIEGNLVSLQKPLAILRRAQPAPDPSPTKSAAANVEVDDDDSDATDMDLPPSPVAGRKRRRAGSDVGLAAPAPSSSPVPPPRALADYSSDAEGKGGQGEGKGKGKGKGKGRDATTERTRQYDIVAVVRRKVVFSKRPGPAGSRTV